MYYEILDNWINVDVGLSLREYDGGVALKTSALDQSENIDFSLPLIYVKARVDLPFTGFFVDAEMSTISYDDEELTDTQFGVGYETSVGFGAKLGYKTFSLKIDEKPLKADFEFSGSYLSVFYHF